MWRQWRRWIFYPVLWLLCMFVPMGVSAWRQHHSAQAAVPAGDSSFDVVSFDAVYAAQRAGSDVALDVTERIVADFGDEQFVAHHGIYRWLPLTYHGHDIGLSVTGVTDQSGHARPYESDEQHDLVGLRIGDPNETVQGRQTYVVRYHIAHAMLRDPNAHQEIYLNVNGTGWAQPVGEVSAVLQLPPDLTGAVDGTRACYVGTEGSTTRCTVSGPPSASRVSQREVGAHQTVTFAVGFQPGTVASTIPFGRSESGRLARIARGLALPLLALVLVALALLMRWWGRRGGHLTGEKAKVEFQAPMKLPAVVAADFLGVPERGVAAELVQQVKRGSVKVGSSSQPIGTSPQGRDGLSQGQQRDLRDDLRVWTTGQPFDTHAEGAFAHALFGEGTPRRLDAATPDELAVASAARQEMFRAAWLREPARTPMVLLVAGMAVLLVAGWWQLHAGVASKPLFLLAGVVAVVLLVEAVHLSPSLGRLTPNGQVVAQKLGGLRTFVLMAEADRLAWMQNAVDAPRVSDGRDASLVKIYEPLLPWAIIFGAEKTWIDLLGRLQTQVEVPSPDLSHLSQLAEAVPQLTATRSNRQWNRTYYMSDNSWWQSRSEFGHGSIAAGAVSLSGILAKADRSNRGSGSSWGGGSSGGSSGGGTAGGGMGGGGGGGW